MKIIISLVALALMASMAVAEDFSVTLQKARPWPGKAVAVAGMQSRTAPAKAVTAVRFWTRGWVTGTNSRPMTVWAVPRAEEAGTRWRIVSVKAYCNNPATGEWLERKPVITVVVTAPPPPERTETLITERFRPNLPPPMIGGREISPGFPLRYGTRSEAVEYPQLLVGWCKKPADKKSENCPPGNPPPPPQ